MGRINILTSDVYNLISAGEVVERPASVVKELIENSIDAGATEIDVKIENGGISLIQISDNGIGILPEDIKSVFLPHATSKLKIADDLETIATLGFRGEALASISAVSEVNLISKTESAEVAVALSVKGGVYGNVEYLSGKKGTTITVQNLFYNTPARIKFLKKPKSEEHLVTSKIQELALANPEISFKYTVDKRMLFSTDGTSMLSALHSIYDRTTMRELVPFSTNHGAISLSGYFSKPTYTKANRSYQTIIINGRVVSNNTVSTAIERAYAPYLMKRSFPMFIVSIMLPFDTVDVNVHPAKSEVRFADNNAVFGFVFSVMREMLSSAYSIKTFGQDFVAKDIEQSNFEDINPNKNELQNKLGKIYSTSATNNYENKLKIDAENETEIKDESQLETANKNFEENINKKFEMSSLYALDRKSRILRFSDSPYSYFGAKSEIKSGFAEDREIENQIASENNNYVAKNGIASENEINNNYGIKNEFANENDKQINNPQNSRNLEWLKSYKIIGQLFDTYIILEKENEVYIIDQHAAHERILYDNLVASIDNSYSQPMLFPYEIKLNSVEFEYFKDILPALKRLGFEVDINDNLGVLFIAIPLLLVDIELNEFVKYLFEDIKWQKKK